MKSSWTLKVSAPNHRSGKAVDNGGLRYGAMESALRPPLPTATRRVDVDPKTAPRGTETQSFESGLTQGRSEHLGEIVRAPSGSFSPEFESSLVVYGAHEIDREVSDDGHVGRAVAFAQAGHVFAEVNVQHPVQLVVSRPEGFHLRPLSERCGSLSTHTAPIKQTRPWSFAANV